MGWFSRLRKNSMWLVILGGAALQRCDNCMVLNAALAVYDEIGVVKHTSAWG